MSANIDVAFKLNGIEVRARVSPGMSALEMLRDELHLTGSKYGCGEGECGACTVNVEGLSINSCLMFAADCDGREIVTIEGLASDPHTEALKKSFVAYGAVQCGFCTPGMVVAAKALLDENPEPTTSEVRRAISGNLCRCTGYQQIVDAVMAAASDMLTGTPH